MRNAEKIPCDVLYRPQSLKYHEDIRMFQGCPTIAVTKGGRIYLGWYSGGTTEPHMSNYNLLVYSDDKGTTWSDPLLVIPSSYERCVHALDIQLFIDPKGRLHVQWVQNNTEPAPKERPQARAGQPLCFVDGYMFNDFMHSEWEIICEEPDAEEPVFSDPRYVYPGFLRCKPTFLANGDWLCFAYDQLTDRYGYSISTDGGESFTHCYGSKKLATYFDEAMAYQREDGSVRMFARTGLGELAESYSCDNGRSWSETVQSGIVSADTRFYVKKLSSGRVLLVRNDNRKSRSHMTLCLSEDDGRTWKYRLCIDERNDISYPDADELNGRIYLTYDRERVGAKEILFTSFTEEDIMEKRKIEMSVVSKPMEVPAKAEVIKAVEDNKIVAILRGVPGEKVVAVAKALYDGGIRLLEITYDASGKVSDEETAKNIGILAKEFAGKLYVGAGTVITAEQVRLTKAAGGLFIISPNTDEEVIKESVHCGLVSMPGALTPSEIMQAHKYGADFVKLFPISNFGTGYVKAIKAPLSHIKLLAVGGIDENNIRDYMKTGVCGFGIGSNIVSKKLVDSDDYAGMTELARKYVEAVK
ncbi:MAG: bifunctional 4-hydroxy-2-oxoglutarate aldolase/2-dehydro-3-deoxy-phosphogluconate aldolase [Ruminococcaceae bacterium]|nr:bifunctional 4-hydroxy-2-oxoglutarate aldolase/2-dehydro-3-deoxy-phosphogluconate aldolase [Oscillospiraceae bacterium]